MTKLARIFLAAVLLVVAAFCLFGFMATFEPNARSMLWRIVYGSFGALFLLAGLWTGWLAWSQKLE